MLKVIILLHHDIFCQILTKHDTDTAKYNRNRNKTDYLTCLFQHSIFSILVIYSQAHLIIIFHGNHLQSQKQHLVQYCRIRQRAVLRFRFVEKYFDAPIKIGAHHHVTTTTFSTLFH